MREVKAQDIYEQLKNIVQEFQQLVDLMEARLVNEDDRCFLVVQKPIEDLDLKSFVEMFGVSELSDLSPGPVTLLAMNYDPE